MAKNYTFSEAVEIIAKGKDLESIADLGRRYPILTVKVKEVATKAGDAFIDLMSYMPDYLTANKINTAIKNVVAGTEPDESTETEKVEKVEEIEEDEKDKSNETEKEVDYNAMSAKQLWDMLGKAGKRKVAKSTKKADLVEACEKVFGGKTTEEEATEENPYEGKTAVELFKECKKRGIKAAPKKPAKFYIDLLVKDDEAAKEAVAGEDDDWGDEEKVEETPKKPTKKSKPKKEEKVEEEDDDDDDDDDWDI